MVLYKVGIVGYGLSAKTFHIPFIEFVDSFELYAIVQRSPKPNNDIAHDHPNVKAYQKAEQLVNDKNVDVIVVTTPPESHFSLGKLALEAGKHVVLEKPFVTTSAEAEELIELAKEKRLICTVYQNRRWDTDFLTLKKYLDNGTLGRIVEFETHFDQHRPELQANSWKAFHAPGTGAVYDLATHLMDQVVFQFGMPQQITGFVTSQRENNPTNLEDSCTILLHYHSPKMLVTVKRGVVGPDIRPLRFWVRGDRGSWKKYHLDPQEDQMRKQGLRPGAQGFGYEPEDRYGELTVVNDGKLVSKLVNSVEPSTYAEFYHRLAQTLDGDWERVPVTPAQAIGVIRLVELARKSSQLGKTLDVKTDDC